MTAPAGHLWLLLGITLFSSVEVATKWVGRDVSPLWLAVARFLLTGVLLFGPAGLSLRRRGVGLSLCDIRRMALLGLIGVTLAIGCYHLAIPRMRANAAAILFSANPAFVALFSPWLLGERPGRRQIAGMACGLAGVTVFLARPAEGLDTRAGILLMTVSLVLFALYSVLAKRDLPRYGPFPILSLAGLAGSALLLPLAWGMEGPPGPALANVSWPGLAYLSVVATALAYAAYFHGLHLVGATRGAFYFFLKPVLASLIAWLWLGEELTPPLIAGGLLVLASLALAQAPGRRAGFRPVEPG